MAFTTFNYCIVSDDVRQEQGAKLTIIGFYGAIPQVTINLKTVEPMKLVFLLGTGRVSGTHLVAVRILGPDKQPITALTPATQEFNSSYLTNNLICTFNTIAFNTSGLHTFQFIIDGEIQFSGDFHLQSA